MACLEFQMVVKKEDYATIWVPKICVFQELRLWIELARSIAKLICKRVDLCHQSDDEDEEDEESSAEESLLEKTFNEWNSLNADNHNHRRCLPFRLIHVRSRQKIVILATLPVIVIMLACAVIIWIRMGKNPIDSTVVARVYVEVFAGAMLLFAGALACYGGVFCFNGHWQLISCSRNCREWVIGESSVVNTVLFLCTVLCLGSFGTCYFLILLRSACKSLNLSICIHLLKTSGSGLRVLCDFRPSTIEVNITIKLLLVLLFSTVKFCCLSSRFGGMIDMESVEDVANISNVSRITTHSLQLYSHC
ncbi:uncharacterized protein LOC133801067 isoform X2 [Humulus lupulus]|uniref:uncharacterized protein LOC133801067 isoform X2 n=1 Tax=Humulus lupulus TaxID=3486 RepID=UPI002B40EBE4|nr:uncharacterized protein LOC133801067 isoform X2 [Humulus lupulus]XP_062095182.1 uncharacterized protein LOC133801067 isoform X2 [Humulus lupulus]